MQNYTLNPPPPWAAATNPDPLTKLIEDYGEPSTYPLEAFTPVLSGAVSAIAEFTQSPLALAGQCVLGAASYLAQRQVNAPTRDSLEGQPCSLFLLTQAGSGDRKTSCQRLSDRRIYEHDRNQIKSYLIQLDEYNRAYSNAKRLGKKQEAEFLENSIEPRNPKTLFSDTTLQPLIGRFIDKDITNAAWTSDEAGQILCGHTLKDDTRASSLGALTKFWDNGSAERTRSRSNADGSGAAFNVRLTISTLGQAVALAESLTDPLLREQGFLPRFLFAAPRSLAGTRTHTAATNQLRPHDDKRLTNYWTRCSDLLSQVSITERRVIPLQPDAERQLLAFYNETEREQGLAGRYAHMKPFASRAEQHARRLATVMAYFEGEPAITLEIVSGAIALVRHSLSEWERYSGDVQVDRLTADADRLENWLLKQCRANQTHGAYRSEIMQKITPEHLRRKAGLDKALKVLTDQSHAIQTKRDGKAWIELNPTVFSLKPDTVVISVKQSI